MKHDSVAKDYVRLALAIDRHLPGYADCYYGPRAWRDESDRSELRSLAEISRFADGLLAAIAEAGALDPWRRHFLGTQVAAMGSLLTLLDGARVAVADEARSLYDIAYAWTDEAEFLEGHRRLDELLPAGGSLYERMRKFREEARLSVAAFERVASLATRELRRRTAARLPLPEGDSVDMVLVRGKPYAAFLTYLGGFSSRVEIATDRPLHLGFALYVASHEIYPGHHTEFCIKEERLYREGGRDEHCVLPLRSPATTISEGIAECGREVIMADADWVDWQAQELYPAVGLGHLDAERRHLVGQVFRATDGVYGNAVYLVHDRGKTDDEVAAYFQRFRLLSEREARRSVRVMRTQQLRTHYLSYLYGRSLLSALFERHDDAVEPFSRLLCEPTTPSRVRTWIEGGDAPDPPQ